MNGHKFRPFFSAYTEGVSIGHLSKWRINDYGIMYFVVQKAID